MMTRRGRELALRQLENRFAFVVERERFVNLLKDADTIVSDADLDHARGSIPQELHGLPFRTAHLRIAWIRARAAASRRSTPRFRYRGKARRLHRNTSCTTQEHALRFGLGCSAL